MASFRMTLERGSAAGEWGYAVHSTQYLLCYNAVFGRFGAGFGLGDYVDRLFDHASGAVCQG